MVSIKLQLGLGAGAARGHQGTHATVGLAKEPKPVTAEVVHVRVCDGNRGCHRHHGFERIAAFGEHSAPRFRGGTMRSGGHAARMAGGVEVHARRFDWVAAAYSSRPILVASP